MTAAYDPAAHPDEQAYQALTFADGREWLIFEYATPGKPTERRYVVTVRPLTPVDPDHMPVTRYLRTSAVLPFVTAIADARGLGHLFPRGVESKFPQREDTDQP